MMKTGTVYATRSIGTASGVIHTKREIAYVGDERHDVHGGLGEYVVSTPTSWGIALLVDNGPDGWDAYDDVDNMDAHRIVTGAATGREALAAVLGVTSFRVDKD